MLDRFRTGADGLNGDSQRSLIWIFRQRPRVSLHCKRERLRVNQPTNSTARRSSQSSAALVNFNSDIQTSLRGACWADRRRHREKKGAEASWGHI